MHRFKLCILGAFAIFRRATVCYVMSVSVRPHETTRLLLDGFSWNYTFQYFSKICWENSGFINIRQECRFIYMKTNIHFWTYLTLVFLEGEMFQTKVVEKIKTYILCSVNFFFRKSCRLWDNVEKYCGSDVWLTVHRNSVWIRKTN